MADANSTRRPVSPRCSGTHHLFFNNVPERLEDGLAHRLHCAYNHVDVSGDIIEDKEAEMRNIMAHQ